MKNSFQFPLRTEKIIEKKVPLETPVVVAAKLFENFYKTQGGSLLKKAKNLSGNIQKSCYLAEGFWNCLKMVKATDGNDCLFDCC